MEKHKINASTELLNNKIKVCLTSIGLNERYIAVEYLAYILTHMIKLNSDSVLDFETALKYVSERFKIKQISVQYEIKKILAKCSAVQVVNLIKFNIKTNPTLNKIRAIKNYVISKLSPLSYA